MNRKQLVLGIVLADFAAFTAYAVWQYGYIGVFELVFSNWATGLVFTDLVIALSLALFWMRGDSRERGLAFLPYALLTLAFGSVGPLLYLIRREATVAVPASFSRAAQGA